MAKASGPFLDKKELAVRGCVELRETKGGREPFSLRALGPSGGARANRRARKEKEPRVLPTDRNLRDISFTLERANVLAFTPLCHFASNRGDGPKGSKGVFSRGTFCDRCFDRVHPYSGNEGKFNRRFFAVDISLSSALIFFFQTLF